MLLAWMVCTEAIRSNKAEHVNRSLLMASHRFHTSLGTRFRFGSQELWSHLAETTSDDETRGDLPELFNVSADSALCGAAFASAERRLGEALRRWSSTPGPGMRHPLAAEVLQYFGLGEEQQVPALISFLQWRRSLVTAIEHLEAVSAQLSLLSGPFSLAGRVDLASEIRSDASLRDLIRDSG